MIISLCTLEALRDDDATAVVATQPGGISKATTTKDNHSYVLSLSTDRIVRIQRTSDWQEEIGYESRSSPSGCVDYIGLKGSSYFICAGGQRSNLLQVINWKHIKLADQLDLKYAILKIVQMEKDNDYSGEGSEYGEVHNSAGLRDQQQQQQIIKDNIIIVAATTQSIDIIRVINGSDTANTRSTAALKHAQLLNRIHTIPFQYKLDNTFNIQAFNQLINSDNSDNHNTHDDKLSNAYGRITTISCRHISDGIIIIIAINNGVILKLQHLGLFNPTKQQNDKDKCSNYANNWLCTQCEGAQSNVNSPVKCIWLNSHVFVSVHEDGTIVQWGVDNCQSLRRIKVNNMINRELLSKMMNLECQIIDQLTQSIQLCNRIGVTAFADRIGFIDMDSLSELESIEYLSFHAQTITAIAYQEHNNSLIAAVVKDNNNNNNNNNNKNTKDMNNPNTTSLVILQLSSRLKSFFTAYQNTTQNQRSHSIKNQQPDTCELLTINSIGLSQPTQDSKQQPLNHLHKSNGYADMEKQPKESNLRYTTINNNNNYQLQKGKYNNTKDNVNIPQRLNSNSKDKINKNMYDKQHKQSTFQDVIPITNKLSNYAAEQGLNNNSKNDQILRIPQQQLNIVNAVPSNILSNSMPDIYQSRHHQYHSKFHKEVLPNIIPVNIPQLNNHNRRTHSSSRGDKQIKEENQQDDSSTIHRTRLISKNDPLRKQLFVEPNSASPPVVIDTAFKKNWLFSENYNNNISKVESNQDASGVMNVSNNSILFPSQIVASTWRQQQQQQQMLSQQTGISGQSQLEVSKLLSYKQHRSNSSNAYYQYGLDIKQSQNSKIDTNVKSSYQSKDGMIGAVTEFKLSSDKKEQEDQRKKDSKEQGNRHELQTQREEEDTSNHRNSNNLANVIPQVQQLDEVKRKYNQSLESDLQVQYKYPVSNSLRASGKEGGENKSQVSGSVDLNTQLSLKDHNTILGQSRIDSSLEGNERIKQIVKDKRDIISNHNNNQQNQKKEQIDQQNIQAETIKHNKIALNDMQHPKQLSHNPSPQQRQFKKQSPDEGINQDTISENVSESKERSFQALQQHRMNSSMRSRSQNSSCNKIRQNSSSLKNAKKQYDYFDEVLRRVDIDSSDKRQLLGSSNQLISKSSKSKTSKINRSSSSKSKLLEQLSDDGMVLTKNQGIQEESKELRNKIRQNSMLVALSKNAQALINRVITLEDESMRFRAEIAEIKRVNQQFQKQLRTYSLCNMRSLHERDLEGSGGRNQHTSRVRQVDQKEIQKYDSLDSSSKIKKRPVSSSGEYSNKKSFKYQPNKINDSHSSISIVQSSSLEKSWKKRSNTQKAQSSFEDDLLEWNSLREKITEKLEGIKEKRRKEEEDEKKKKQQQQQRQSSDSVGILQDKGIKEGGMYLQRVESAKKKGLAKISSNSISNTQQQHNANSIMTTSNCKSESTNKNKNIIANKEKQQQYDQDLQQQLNYADMNKRYYYISPTLKKNENKQHINSQLRQSNGELDQLLLFSGGQKLLTTELSVLAYTEGTGEKSGNRSYSGNNKNSNSSVQKSIKSAVVQEKQQQSLAKVQTSSFSVGRGYKQHQQNTTKPSAVGSISNIQSSLPMRFGDCLDGMKVFQEGNRDLRRESSAKGKHK